MTRAELNQQKQVETRTPLANKLVWLFPVAFIVHDAEETLTIKAFLDAHHQETPFNRLPVSQLTTSTFAMSVLLILLVIVGLCSYITKNRTSGQPLFLLLASTLFMNGVTHVLQALYFRGYTPGVVTAVLTIFPYSIWVWRSMNKVHGVKLAKYLAAGMVLQIPLAVGALIAGSLLL
ncbi:HXXEE domain-containing protein [Fictibacillus sp. KU28468]|uniref:HXXEE domain-containing protein n=1 Tax=Fictibacillus sp. KU28468 TaxID=2991053 RepID=UPI00223E127B|nr:HXXEE domain-containing protein [Fictibacillus sp. KU28468]UZJ78641.1 HXXEE domain-containing protein [Fictibacillus sp. KU28468]